ncbi:MAG TPA: TonB family protein [Xanthobacteraceae bacterium]|nr:TonB family protein [Xanthobacteraceae bacterium]
MTVASRARSREDRPWGELARWLACGTVVLLAHAGVAAALMEWRAPIEDEEVGTDAIIVEFQPEQVETEPAPQPIQQVEKNELLPEQKSEAMLPLKPQEVLPEPPKEEVPYVPPRPAQARAEVATWKSQIITLLEHNKRYPADARARGEQGLARLALRIDQDGRLISSRIVASSGSAALDAETLALVQRAQPFPPPPPELAGSELIVPLRFNIR